MNRHSIFFKLNLLFGLALLITAVAAISVFAYMGRQARTDLVFKSRLALQELRRTHRLTPRFADMLDMHIVKGKERAEILQKGRRLGGKYHKKRPRRRFFFGLITYHGRDYVRIDTPRAVWLLAPGSRHNEQYIVPAVIFIMVVVLLSIIYWLIRHSLMPLKQLEKDIRLYGSGEMPQKRSMDGKDEISCLNNAFYSSIERIKRLGDSRQLFLRNIFHELNTPVTKGKLLAELTREKQTKTMLESIFGRLSVLLEELAQIERIAAAEYVLKPGPVRIIELIDHARDLLFIKEKIPGNIEDQIIVADFSSMGIVFKNLIDNAVKYGKDLEIYYRSGEICFSSTGKPLKHSLDHYTEAFSKGADTISRSGFGLGLYIVKEILRRHDMDIGYRYIDGKNIFFISVPKERLLPASADPNRPSGV